MIPITRRQWLTGSGSLIMCSLADRVSAGDAGIPRAPVARVEAVKNTYFGETLSDPYRWMENDKDPDWLPFLKGQDAHTRAMLARIPGRAGLLKRIQALSGDTAATLRVQRAGGRLFYQQRPAGAEGYKLFVQEGVQRRVLVDPTQLSVGQSHHYSLDWWQASPDGRHVAYGLSKDGSEDSVLHILTVSDGKDLPEQIPGTEGASPHWLEDGSGFFYNQLTGQVGTPERYLDSQARFHRLGADPAADPIVMRRGLDPQVTYERIQMPNVVTFGGSRHVLLMLSDVRQESRFFLAPLADVLAGQARWTPVAGFEDEVTDAEIDGDTLYLLANKDHPRGRVLRTPVTHPSVHEAVEVVPESQGTNAEVIRGLSLAKNGLYLEILDGGLGRLALLSRDGKVTPVALPFEGTLAGLTSQFQEEGALFGLTSWLRPADFWSVDTAGHVQQTHLTPAPAIDVSGYETERLFATAPDGTRIPYSLIYKKGLKRDGRTPAWISAYGSYGAVAYSPAFAGRSLALIDAGFIVGYAHVRGGGEYGREWHKAGQLENKPNTWRDLIAVCEDLVAKQYTSPAHLAIGGRSAGGITVGRAMEERPELFAAVVDGVGWSNPLRYVAEQNSYGEEPEWGAIAEERGYRALKAIDSYQAVKDGTAYPAVLLTTGVTDPRVAPFHVGKMTARLQAATASHHPVLLRVDFDAGHGIGSTRAQQDAEAADTYAFLLWQTGAKDYQPG